PFAVPKRTTTGRDERVSFDRVFIVRAAISRGNTQSVSKLRQSFHTCPKRTVRGDIAILCRKLQAWKARSGVRKGRNTRSLRNALPAAARRVHRQAYVRSCFR